MKHAERHGIFKIFCMTSLTALGAALCIMSMPVNYLTVTGRGEILFSCPVPNGYPFLTVYTHSLQLTSVKDDYRFVSGKMWGWEEWTQSHNAGLPSVLSPGMKVIVSQPWMINRGGRIGHNLIYYRIGSRLFGQNVWFFEPWGEIRIFEKYPSYRMELRASPVPLRDAKIFGFDTIGQQRDANEHVFSM
ncbi:MAG: DUF1850 domain-containing protein [Synergistaceae bacterium]|jgi:hypothetical protein|nr:DUF1850 domain-containing protein [Synergistaceae bacterium]